MNAVYKRLAAAAGHSAPALLAKFLRAFQEGRVHPVGAVHALPVDVRILAAVVDEFISSSLVGLDMDFFVNERSEMDQRFEL